MGAINVFITKQGIFVADTGNATSAAIQKLEQMVSNGEATNAVVNLSNSSAPTVEKIADANTMQEIWNAMVSQNSNQIAREALAAVAGTLAGLGALELTGNPWAGLLADKFASDLFKQGYDSVASLANSDAIRNALRDLGNASSPDWQDLEKQLHQDPNWRPGSKWQGASQSTNTAFKQSRNWVAPPPRMSPLALDLDGDGVETIGLNGSSSVLFDHDGDGVRTGTGWIKADDGLLALDRDGNGTIGSGGELFGVNTLLANGSRAADGFAALSELDSNGDEVFNAEDERFGDVRVWRDLNQDGISQSGELMSLVDAGVAAINLNATHGTGSLGNGNNQIAASSYTRANGTVAAIVDVDFAVSDFYRQFTTPVALTAEARAMPNIQGSGAVRDLREAASLSAALATTAAGINATLSPAQMRAQVDVLFGQWADTSTMQGGIEQAATRGMKVFYLTPGTTQANIEAFRDLLGGMPTDWTGATRTVADLSDVERQQYESLLARTAANIGWRMAA